VDELHSALLERCRTATGGIAQSMHTENQPKAESSSHSPGISQNNPEVQNSNKGKLMDLSLRATADC